MEAEVQIWPSSVNAGSRTGEPAAIGIQAPPLGERVPGRSARGGRAPPPPTLAPLALFLSPRALCCVSGCDAQTVRGACLRQQPAPMPRVSSIPLQFLLLFNCVFEPFALARGAKEQGCGVWVLPSLGQSFKEGSAFHWGGGGQQKRQVRESETWGLKHQLPSLVWGPAL